MTHYEQFKLYRETLHRLEGRLWQEGYTFRTGYDPISRHDHITIFRGGQKHSLHYKEGGVPHFKGMYGIRAFTLFNDYLPFDIRDEPEFLFYELTS